VTSIAYGRNEPSTVISTPQPEATETGIDILANGGNAVDAAIAASLVQGVIDPLMCGIGGMAVIQVATSNGKVHVIDGLGKTPLDADEHMWSKDFLGSTTDGFGYRVTDARNEYGPESVLTPGFLQSIALLHSEYGKLSWADLFGPAIEIARNGWMIRPHNATVFHQDERRYGRVDYGEKLVGSPDGRKLYSRENGYPRVGELIINSDLAETLTVLAKEGVQSFYTGTIARSMIDSIRRDGGLLSAADLEYYTVTQPEPASISYRGWDVYMPPYPAGGVQALQTLSILKEFDISSLEHNSPDHLIIMSEALKAALSDKERLWSSKDASASSFEMLLDSRYVCNQADMIKSGHRFDVDAGRNDSPHTTHLSVISDDGTAVSMTHTLGNPSGYIPTGLGFMMNGGMSTFDPRPGSNNSIAPGKRRSTTSAPTIVLSNQRPIIAVGAPGASWITSAVVQSLSNVLDFGMSAQEAVMAPRIAITSNAVDISNRIPRRVQRVLEGRDYEVRRSPLSYAFAAPHMVTAVHGRLDGGADPQRDGYADTYGTDPL